VEYHRKVTMTKTARENSVEARAQELLDSGAAAELRLLKQERKAELHLAEALTALERNQQRLSRALQRVERSQALVSEAESALRECQARRAAGPYVELN
jgi:putative cell wall-binding protein